MYALALISMNLGKWVSFVIRQNHLQAPCARIAGIDHRTAPSDLTDIIVTEVLTMYCAVARSPTNTTQTTTTSKASISAADESSDKKLAFFAQKSETNRNSGYDTTRRLTPGTTIYVQNSQATPAGTALNRDSCPPGEMDGWEATQGQSRDIRNPDRRVDGARAG
jgi:hypothetical protein